MPKTTSQLDRHAELDVPTDNSSSSVANDNAPLRDEEHTTLEAKSVAQPANDDNDDSPSEHPTGIEYLRHKHQSQLYPGVVYEYDATRAAVEAVGAGGIMDPTPYRDHQIVSRQLYFGVAVPPGSNEVIHRHDAPEIYVQIAGFARVWTKWYFADEWFERDLAPGDALLCQPGICHLYQWLSPIGQGLAMVFKAPARGGVGRGTGKITCEDGCPLFGDRCAGPASLPHR